MATLADNALCTLDDVKESMGIASGDSSWNNLIIRKINQVSTQIEGYCSRSFKAADYTEEYNGSHTDQLVLKQRPINSFTSLEYRGTSLNSDSWSTLNSTYYFVDESAGILRLLFISAGRWARWRANYNAGYTTIPSDLAEAAATLAAYYTNNASASDVGVSSKKEGQRQVSFATTNLTFKGIAETLGVNQIIDGYANWPLISE